MDMDIWDEKVKALLPCSLLPGCSTASDVYHNYGCIVWKRPAVAAALREQGEAHKAEVEKLLAVIPHMDNHHNAAYCPYCRPKLEAEAKHLADLRAQLDVAKIAGLEAAKAEADKFECTYLQEGCVGCELIQDAIQALIDAEKAKSGH